MLIVLGGLAVLLAAIGVARLAVRARRADALTAGAAAVALVLGGVLAISPATWRNWRVTGEVVPISSHGGWNFLAGNGPQADGTYTTPMNLSPSIAGQWLGAADVVRQATGRDPSARGVGHRLLGVADEAARELGVSLLRVDCYAGGD